MSDAKSYIIISQLPPDVYRKFVEDANSTCLTGFTFVVVGIIQLAGGRVAEGVLVFLILSFIFHNKIVCFIC